VKGEGREKGEGRMEEGEGRGKGAYISTAVREETMLVLEIMTPLGTPVVPKKIRIARKEGGRR
jgi:hypothetical protein